MNTEFDDLLDAFLNDELETKTKNADDNMVEEPLYEIMPALEPYISRGTTYYVPAPCSKPQFYFRRFSLLIDSEELSSEGEQKSLRSPKALCTQHLGECEIPVHLKQ